MRASRVVGTAFLAVMGCSSGAAGTSAGGTSGSAATASSTGGGASTGGSAAGTTGARGSASTTGSGSTSGGGTTSGGSSGAASTGPASTGSSTGSSSTGGLPPAGAPLVIYTDLVAGPNSGGENGDGTYLSIVGKNFGNGGLGSTVRVTIGGVEVASYRSLGPCLARPDIQQITVQVGGLGSPAPGTPLPISVSVNGIASNTDQTFTVNPGNLLFVDGVKGNDSTAVAGDITHPFLDVAAALGTAGPGDTLVFRGTGATYTATSKNYVYLSSGGSQPTGAAGTGYLAFLAYPGETVQIQNTTNAAFDADSPASWIAIAGLHLEGDGNSGVINLNGPQNDHWRIVNNELTAPTGFSAKSGGVNSDGAGYVEALGNRVHDLVCHNQELHGFYIGGDGDIAGAPFEIAYNVIYDVEGGNGIQTHGGNPTIDAVWIHHNLIFDITAKHGLNLVDGTGSDIRIYDNILYDIYGAGLRLCGTDANPCADIGPTAYVDMKIYNNTFYDCDTNGAYGAIYDSAGTIMPGQIDFQNNIVWPAASASYMTGLFTGAGLFTNNLWYGAGAAPSLDPLPATGDPLFADAGGDDFHLTAGSPAIDAGATDVASLVTNDYDVVTPRPQGGGYDIGAFEVAR